MRVQHSPRKHASDDHVFEHRVRRLHVKFLIFFTRHANPNATLDFVILFDRSTFPAA